MPHTSTSKPEKSKHHIDTIRKIRLRPKRVDSGWNSLNLLGFEEEILKIIVEPDNCLCLKCVGEVESGDLGGKAKF